MNQNVSLTNVTKDSSDTATKCYLTDSSRVVISSATFSGDNCVFSSPQELTAGITYYLLEDNDGGSYNRRYKAVALPQSFTIFNLTHSWQGSGDVATEIIGIESVGFQAYTNSTETWNRTITEGIIWNVKTCVSDETCEFAPSNYTFTIDSTPPSISISSPISLQDYGKLNSNLTLNFTATDTNLDTCWYSYNGTNTTVSCSSGVVSSNEFALSTSKTLTIYVNDTTGNINSEVVSWDYKIFENSRTYNTTDYETAYSTYLINLTANSSLTAVNLLFNGTSYSMTSLGSGVWSYARDLPPSTIGSNSINFSFTYAGSTIYSNNLTTQTISAIQFGICNSTLTNDFLNISFKDENDLTALNATIPTSSFTYYLGSGSVNKTYTLVNNTENYNYTFCATPTDRTFNVAPEIQYQSTGYPQRIYQPSLISLTSTVTNTILYLLGSADGIYVTFQVLGATDLPLSGVEVTAIRSISGEEVTVGKGTTDASGIVTLWLNPDFQHNMTFSKTGYDYYSTVIYPTQTTYTINLGTTSTVSGDTQYSRGINITIQPLEDFINKNQSYNFNYTISTDYWTLDSWGYNLYYSNGTLADSQSSSSDTGGVLNTLLNTSNQSKIIMQYYYVVNGTYVNGSRFWLTETPNDFSIKHLFTRIGTYISLNMFGIQSDDEGQFGKGLICVLILVGTTGLLGSRYGLNSESAIMGVIFGVLLFLNSLGFVPNPDFLSSSPVTLGDFVVFVSLVILIGFIFKEEAR